MKNLRIIRANELAELLSVSITTIFRMYKNGDLPPKVKISKRAVGWTESDIEEWIQERTIDKEIN